MHFRFIIISQFTYFLSFLFFFILFFLEWYLGAADGAADQVATETDSKNAQVAVQPKYVVGGAVIGTVGLLIVAPIVGAIVVIGK